VIFTMFVKSQNTENKLNRKQTSRPAPLGGIIFHYFSKFLDPPLRIYIKCYPILLITGQQIISATHPFNTKRPICNSVFSD